jgi:CheY-like chemotaxis protein
MACILIVEDDKDLREMLRDSLVKRKHTVLEASNGKEAILRFKPSITDLLITDLIMPDEDGLKLIMDIKTLKPAIKIIAISGGGKAGPGNYLDVAKALGANAVFPKPFSLKDLLTKIGELLNPEQA